MQPWMEAEVIERVGAARWDRTPVRTTSRNGHRPRGGGGPSRPLASPQLRQGSDVPGVLTPRKRSEPALGPGIPEAAGNGVSPRTVDQRVQALELEGVSKRPVSRIAQERDARLTAFRGARGTAGIPPRVAGGSARETPGQGPRFQHGAREVLGFDGCWSVPAAFGTNFLRRRRARGLTRGALGPPRRPPEPPARHPAGGPGRRGAAVPRALPAASAEHGPSLCAGHGGRPRPDDLRPRDAGARSTATP
ncbi:MAG: transposase [Firmicutes bacterium]|nr:transposase [Alicyclobacillaceae bacterium]MCL6496220.1 transposase [Bacillota bacterium]